MLEDYCRKAKLEDGMSLLDMGCGWGSLCLYLARVSRLTLPSSEFGSQIDGSDDEGLCKRRNTPSPV